MQPSASLHYLETPGAFGTETGRLVIGWVKTIFAEAGWAAT